MKCIADISGFRKILDICKVIDPIYVVIPRPLSTAFQNPEQYPQEIMKDLYRVVLYYSHHEMGIPVYTNRGE